MNILSGYKTYIVALATLVYAGVSVWNGTMNYQTAILTVLGGLGLGALRHGVAKGGRR